MAMPRRTRPVRRSWRYPDDLFDYLKNNSPEPLPTQAAEHVSIVVTDDWPAVVPITDREVQLTEAHLERVLAELFGPLP